MANVEHPQSLQVVKLGCLHGYIVVHLQLEDVLSLAHLAKNPLNYAFGGQQSIATILSFLLMRKSPVIYVCGSNNK